MMTIASLEAPMGAAPEARGPHPAARLRLRLAGVLLGTAAIIIAGFGAVQGTFGAIAGGAGIIAGCAIAALVGRIRGRARSAGAREAMAAIAVSMLVALVLFAGLALATALVEKRAAPGVLLGALGIYLAVTFCEALGASRR
jgi:LytS/YehU family sensor histidine kinase